LIPTVHYLGALHYYVILGITCLDELFDTVFLPHDVQFSNLFHCSLHCPPHSLFWLFLSDLPPFDGTTTGYRLRLPLLILPAGYAIRYRSFILLLFGVLFWVPIRSADYLIPRFDTPHHFRWLRFCTGDLLTLLTIPAVVHRCGTVRLRCCFSHFGKLCCSIRAGSAETNAPLTACSARTAFFLGCIPHAVTLNVLFVLENKSLLRILPHCCLASSRACIASSVSFSTVCRTFDSAFLHFCDSI